MTDRFVDANVLVFAFGGSHPLRLPCRELIVEAQAGSLTLHAGTEALEDFVHHRMRRTARATALANARELAYTCVIHACDDAALRRALDLIETTNVRSRDAMHAATALQHGFHEIISIDSDFDDIPGLTRVDPRDLR